MAKYIFFRVSSFMLFLTVVFFLSSCQDQKSVNKKNVTSNYSQESVINANKMAVKTEEQQINDFIERVKWKMLNTGTGLKYNIYEKGSGEPAVSGKVAELEYSVSFITGDVAYSSKDLGNKVFTIGKGGVESGLEEGILFLHEGDRAKFIIPSHLAFGLMGDQNKIPPKTTLIYDVKLIKIK